ncbi:hypothetical protein [Kaistia soli]|uniref:hypothetical protein n=1 Tax=Kaistia soli TaxID=446684 RepID=UPI001114A9A6|nr:hypothetical protein [Kaistia soli]
MEASYPVSPVRTRSGLERLFEAIEAADEVGSASGPTQARRDDVSVAPTPDEGPLVSIGRITISVAPPPASASSAPTGPPRSHGFSAYARLRGGYER